MSQSRCFILIHDHQGRPVHARATLRTAAGHAVELAHDEQLQRQIGRGLEPGTYELHVQGPKGTQAEVRTIVLQRGDNHASVMVSDGRSQSLRTRDGKWYFELRDDIRLLHVQGAQAREHAEQLVKKYGLAAAAIDPASGARADEVLLQIDIGSSKDGQAQVDMLERIVSEELRKRGLQARVAVPGYVGKEIAFGITDEIVVRFQSAATRKEIDTFGRRYGLQELRPIAWIGNAYLFRFPGGAGRAVLDASDRVSADPLVVYAEPNVANRLESFNYTPGDYLYPETPHLRLVNADDAWDTIQTATAVNRGGSPSVVVAVLDLDGVDPTHPDLTGTLSDGSTKQIANFDFVNMTNQTFVNLGGDHGTQCAGSATSRFDNVAGTCGVAPNCKLIGGRFSGFATDLQIADIWVWMAGFPTGSTTPGFPAPLARGADIISNSWGPNFKPSNQTLRDAFDFLTTYPRNGRGVIMAFATGNYGYSLVDTRNPFAADEKTLGIGASINSNPTNPVNSVQADQNGNLNNLPAVVDTRTYFSPYGLTVDLVAPAHTCYGAGLPGAGIVDPIMAPSRTGLGDWPGSATATTSLTAPVAVGATALPVGSTAGFAAGAPVLLGTPGAADSEAVRVTSVTATQLNVTAVRRAHVAGAAAATGPADYAKNASVGFGGTSHACPTVAGAAALLLSVKPDLNWVEVRQILRTTAVRIDFGQTFATGQWTDLDGDGIREFSQWYGHGRLDIDAAVQAAIALTTRTDVVVRDNLSDNGGVPSAGWHAASPDIWVRRADDPVPALAYPSAPPHENPRAGQANHVYVRVRNNGTAMAPVVYVRAMIAHFAGIEFVYPHDWQPTPRLGNTPGLPLQPGTYLIGEVRIDNLPAGGDQIVKMTWPQNLVPPETVTIGGTPVHWHPCLLAEATPHDGPAVVTGLAYPVKGDNNIAHRNIAIDYTSGSSGAASGLMSAVVAGTRAPRGVDSLLLDRSGVPASVGVLVRVEDEELMKLWVDMAQSGKGFEQIAPLGAGAGEASEDWALADACAITLLEPAQLAVECCGGGALIIEAPRRTRLRLVCGGGGRRRSNTGVRVEQYRGKPVLRLDDRIAALALPLPLAAATWAPILVGTDPVNTTGKLRGQLRLSQRRSDGEVAAGYELEV